MTLDCLSGTWKLNAEKSKYIGVPAMKEAIVTVTPDSESDGWRWETNGISGEGLPMRFSFVYKRDDEDITMRGYPYADTIVLQNGKSKIGAGTFKRAGRVVGDAQRTISPDGRTMTVSIDIALAGDKKASFTAVYEKQSVLKA